MMGSWSLQSEIFSMGRDGVVYIMDESSESRMRGTGNKV